MHPQDGESAIAVEHFKNQNPGHPLTVCVHGTLHVLVSPRRVDGKTLIWCSACDAMVSDIPQEMINFYQTEKAIGWVAPLKAEEIDGKECSGE